MLFLLIFILKNKKWAFIAFAVYCLIILLLTLTGIYKGFSAGMKFLFNPINIEFFMGVLSAVIVTKIPAFARVPLILLGSSLFIISSGINNSGTDLTERDLLRMLCFGIPSFILIVGIVSYEINFKVKVNKIFLLLGEASYSLYLIHLPLVVAFAKLYPKLKIQNDLIFHLLFLVLIFLICFISILVFRFIEKPIIAKLNSRFNNTNKGKINKR
jgi:peptidoglycan/LPS O-acetylase OafA/YrhL